jgi:hypothetical protein
VEEHPSGRHVRYEVRAVEGRRLIPRRKSRHPNTALARGRELTRRYYDVTVGNSGRGPLVIIIVIVVVIVIIIVVIIIIIFVIFVPVVVPIAVIVIRSGSCRAHDEDEQACEDGP